MISMKDFNCPYHNVEESKKFSVQFICNGLALPFEVDQPAVFVQYFLTQF